MQPDALASSSGRSSRFLSPPDIIVSGSIAPMGLRRNVSPRCRVIDETTSAVHTAFDFGQNGLRALQKHFIDTFSRYRRRLHKHQVWRIEKE